ncbi:hypothetical protein ACWDA7_04025 [Streptomyces sp. NPDC001156]
MLQATWLRGRRGAVIGASTAVVCLGGVLAASAGGAGGEGYVAVGPAGDSPRASGSAVAPTGDVTLVPLERAGSERRGASSGASTASGPPVPGPGAAGTVAPGSAGALGPSGGPAGGDTSAHPAEPSPYPAPAGTGSPSPTPTVPRATPSGPAVLSVGETVRETTDQRWCEKVTVPFRNTGGSAVRSGTVTFGTHVIGALGIDWATIESKDALPAPIAAGASVKKTWTVCVDAWRVPLGMHIETRDVSVQWK